MRRLVGAAVFFLSAAGLGHAQNLLTNPGFETGDFSGWYKATSAGTTQCAYNQPDEHSGERCFCEEGCCGAFGDVCAEQTVTTSSGSDYTVGGWMKGCGGEATQLYADGSACSPSGSPFAANSDCTYTYYSTVITGSGSDTIVCFAAGSNTWGAGGSVHWDDLEIIAVGVGDWVLY